MAFTFDPALSTDRDKVRFKIGDVDSGAPLLQDETVDALLVINAGVLETSIAAVKAILAKLSRDADKTALGITSNLSQKSAQYRAVLRDLEAEAEDCPTIYFGGASRSETLDLESDPDFVRPAFTTDQHDNPQNKSRRTGRGRNDGC